MHFIIRDTVKLSEMSSWPTSADMTPLIYIERNDDRTLYVSAIWFPSSTEQSNPDLLG